MGFGGGSSYIAILLLSGLAQADVRATALLCNIIVVSIACFRYYQKDLYRWKEVLPLVLLSIPFSYVGGRIILSSDHYTTLAGVVLFIASITMLTTSRISIYETKLPTIILSAIGGGIGFISGVIGIGGGIFLSPILHLVRWKKAVVISAMASLFILVNSTAGLLGQWHSPAIIKLDQVIPLALAVAVGGMVGSHISIHRLNQRHIRILTAILVGIIGLRILLV